MCDALSDTAQLADLFAQHGSPLNLHHLGPFGDNYRAYADLLDQHNLKHLIFFARKANKSKAFVQAAQQLGFGVDTASYRELAQALELGNAPEKLVLTAAIKPAKLVRLALENDVLIVLDNVDECVLVDTLAREMGKTAIVGIRISGFTVAGEQLYSRFGFPVDDAVAFISQMGATYPNLQFKGFHFHLNGYSRHERGAALATTIACADSLREMGIATDFIDIGGGLLVRYLQEQSQWETFMHELKRAVRGEREPITFGNNPLGLQLVAGKIYGEPNVYPYFNTTPKATFLAEVLDYRAATGETVAAQLRNRAIELRLEPGRSLLDQTGITVAQVAFRKWDSRGDLLVGLEMNRTQMYSSSADFLLDPLLVYRDDPRPTLPPAASEIMGYFVGAYCLEQDIILKRKIPFARVPEIGDWVCFPNTAGYMMHFYETEAHLFELATNLVLRDGQFVLD